jgi:hypothetical protein
MNPLLEKYDELYGPKVEDSIPEYNELPEGYLYSHCATGNYIGDTTYDAIHCHKIKWNGKYWEKISGDILTGTASTDTIYLGNPFPSAYSNDYLTLSSSSITSTTASPLMIDGKDIKDVIKEEVEKQLKAHQKQDQTKAVIDLLEKVKKGTARVQSYQTDISYDLGGSNTSYTIIINE